MTTHPTIRHFRKAALCTVFALAAGIATSASAQQAVPTYTVNANYAAKAIYVQNVNNPSGWACVSLAPPNQNGGFNIAPDLLYGFTYSAYAMSTSDCRGGTGMAGVYVLNYKVNSTNEVYFNVTNTKIYITN